MALDMDGKQIIQTKREIIYDHACNIMRYG